MIPLIATEAQISALVALHQKYLDAISTLVVEVEVRASDDAGKTWKREGSVRWWKDGDRQRFRSKLLGDASPFRSDGLGASREALYDQDETRMLVSPDPPVREPPGPENAYGRVGASIAGPKKSSGLEGPPTWLFFRVDPSNTLPDLHRKATRRKLLGKMRLDGVEVWGLSFAKEEGNYDFHLFLDPARNYALVRREVRPRGRQAGGGVHRVLESREVKPGIFVPTHARNHAANEPLALDVRVVSVKVNEPLAKEAFQLDFPKGVKVRNAKTGERYVWGEGAPALTFPNRDAFVAWEMAQMGLGPGQTFTKFFLVNVAFLSLLIAILVVRNRYGRRPRPA